MTPSPRRAALPAAAGVCLLAFAAAFADTPADWGIPAAVNAAIGRHELPGAVVAVVRSGPAGDTVPYRQAFGRRSVDPDEPMTVDTVFDLASLTKPIATSTSVMILVEQGKLRLDAKVADYWPEFAANGKDQLTLEHLLLHVSGLIADNPISDYADGRAKAFERICQLKPRTAPGERFVYSDVNFIVLGELVGRVSGVPLDEFARQHIFEPLGMKDTGFKPNEAMKARCAPTEKEKDHWLRGEVHDPRARALGGVAGHAGLFSTADDLTRFARMLLHGGELDGVRIVKPETFQLWTQPRKVPGGLRAYGWDVQTGFSANKGDGFPRDRGFGHTGFTGTSIWVDPGSGTAVIFLSSRLHPDGTKGNATPLRRKVATLVASAVGYAPRPPAPSSTEGEGVRAGIDVLKAEGFARLKGRKVGLVTNHTGRDRDGNPTIDLLHTAEGVTLVALFSPEHGIRGALDEKVGDTKDEKTGLPVWSLYGPRRQPTAELLQGIDTLVYDIQDVGCRYYTYISTLGLILESAAEHKLRVVVLDRPNPIGGVVVDGPVLDPGRESFIAYHRLPLRHGLTVGELARLFNGEKHLSVDLDVVKAEGWHRADFYDKTLLPWVNPSPNLRSLTEAYLYPGIGLLETTNLSVGRGTDTPFEWVGAPWLDGRRLAAALDERRLSGVRFVPTSRTPSSSVFRGQACGGVQIMIDDWARFEPVHTGLTIASELRRLYPDAWQVDKYDNLLRHKPTLDGIKAGTPVAELEAAWRPELEQFRERRKAYLLYND